MSQSRVMLCACASGSGKTMITCAVLQALYDRGLKTVSFKCGPDYIDPMFHAKAIGVKSSNLDLFFTSKDILSYLFYENSKQADISIIEGVMGYYDGIGVKTAKASSYEISVALDIPTVLIVNCKGMSYSIIPVIKGFLEFKKDNRIKGVILNRISPMVYSIIKEEIEKELNIKVFGYFPEIKDVNFESRHLGLVKPDEIKDIKQKLKLLAKQAEETLDLDLLLKLAYTAQPLEKKSEMENYVNSFENIGNIKIALAMDEAFCFYYKENLELLEKMGAEIVYFSPLKDFKLPENVSGLIIGGGYPELYARELSQNTSMMFSIKNALKSGMPCIAECGGFLYLNNTLEDKEKNIYQMTGFFNSQAYKTEKLNRFGYIELTAQRDNVLCKKGEKIKAHEFHYWDSTDCGDVFKAEKPNGKKSWECIRYLENTIAGFPHIYFYSNIKIVQNFLKECKNYGGGK